MDTKSIIKLIKTQISEHTIEIEGCEFEADKIQSKIKQSKEELQKNNPSGIMNTRKLAILKDKAMFHKACVMTLKNLLKEIESENE